MSSYRGSPHKRRAVVLFIVAAFALLILLFARPVAGAFATMLFSPIDTLKGWVTESSGRLPTYLRTQGALIARIQELEAERERRADDAFALTALRAEHELLAGAAADAPAGTLVAGVLSQPGTSPYDTFVIDRGESAGVQEGALVYAGEAAAIGSVIAVYQESALVLLASAPGVHSTAYVFGPDIFTDAVGQGGGTLRIQVPQGIPLAAGNVVMLPGAGRGAYGTVVEVESLASSPFQYGYVTPPVPLRSIRYVHVTHTPHAVVSYEEALAAVAAASSTLFAVPVPEEALVSTSTEEVLVE